MQEELLEKILDDVAAFVAEKQKEKKWQPGVDWVRYAGPMFDTEEYTAAVKTLLRGWLVLGTDGTRFERQFPAYLGKEHGVLVNSGSSANLLMLAAVKHRDYYRSTNVWTAAAGFPTTFNPIIQNGFYPIILDVDLETFNIDLQKLDDITRTHDLRGEMIMFAHPLGNPPNMDDLMDIANRRNFTVLEDCCDALGSTWKGKPLGSFGRMASCSFYPAHHITMGEGGFVACKDKEDERILRSLREWGRGCYCQGEKANLLKQGTCGCRFSNWIPELPNEIFDHKYVYETIGYNLKPIELQASMGLAQLKKLPEIIEKRKANHAALYKVFEKYSDDFILPKATPGADPAWFAFALTIKDGAKFKRADIIDFLESRKIQTRPFFAGRIMKQPAYKNVNAWQLSAPNATKIMKDTFFLGTSPVITQEQINYIEETVAEFYKTVRLDILK